MQRWEQAPPPQGGLVWLTAFVSSILARSQSTNGVKQGCEPPGNYDRMEAVAGEKRIKLFMAISVTRMILGRASADAMA